MFKILSIAASDSIGGAGIQADLRTATLLGVYPATALTAVTAQNSCGVKECLPLDKEIVESQILSIIEDFIPDAVKIGLLPTTECVSTVASMLKYFNLKNVVLDPVLSPTFGNKFTSSGVSEAILNQLLPLVTIITPNLLEFKLLNELTDRPLNSVTNVVVKGGHAEANECKDILYYRNTSESVSYSSKKIDTPNLHGTGCVLSSAIACYLAKGKELNMAVREAKKFLFSKLQEGIDVKFGKCGYGPVITK